MLVVLRQCGVSFAREIALPAEVGMGCTQVDRRERGYDSDVAGLGSRRRGSSRRRRSGYRIGGSVANSVVYRRGL